MRGESVLGAIPEVMRRKARANVDGQCTFRSLTLCGICQSCMRSFTECGRVRFRTQPVCTRGACASVFQEKAAIGAQTRRCTDGEPCLLVHLCKSLDEGEGRTNGVRSHGDGIFLKHRVEER